MNVHSYGNRDGHVCATPTSTEYNKLDAVVDLMESMSIGLDAMAQSSLGCARAGQKSTRATGSWVQRKELTKSYATFCNVYLKLHDLLRRLQLEGEPVEPDTIHCGDARFRALNRHMKLSQDPNEHKFVVGDDVKIDHPQDNM